MSRSFALLLLLEAAACHSPPAGTPAGVETTPIATTTAPTTPPKEPAVLVSARALADALVKCDRTRAKQQIMTFEEAAVMVTKDLPRDHWETSIEQVIDEACRSLSGAAVDHVEITSSETVKPSDKDLLTREITLVTVKLQLADRALPFPHAFVETREGWKMMAEE